MLFKGTRQTPVVSFLICGAQKAGTTALAEYLRGHPELYLPERKELHFFDDENRNWKKPRYEDYHACFRDKSTKRLCGEATPIYMYWDAAPERIWRYNPEMQIILILRNPIERAYSHWAMESHRGADRLSFEEAIDQESIRCRIELPLQHRVYSYQDRGFYSAQIRRLWRFFGEESVLVMRQEDLRRKPKCCLDFVCQHLGVSSFPCIEPLERHTGSYEGKIKPRTRDILKQRFTHEIHELETMLGWDLSHWLEA